MKARKICFYLDDRDPAGGQDQQVLEVGVDPEAAGHDVEHGVGEHPDGGELEEGLSQDRLVFTVKLHLLNPAGVERKANKSNVTQTSAFKLNRRLSIFLRVHT